MSRPILATKLHIPSARPELVARPRLVERLTAGLHRKLTLLSAPAGFGKTTLLSAWIPTSPRCVTWLSLEASDSESSQFWTYFIASLQGLRPDLGRAALAMLQSPQPPPITAVLTSLINDLHDFPDPFAAVLDDYHVIDARPIDEALAFLLDHLPPHMHLLITSRDDPNLPLARLRARDQMNELRVRDLRFTTDEAAAFLNQVTGRDLSAQQVAALEARTEGWVAGLHLAALSLRGRPDPARFIASFTGSNRFVMDYLIEEVLQQQPQEVQSFLLRTSILERLCGPLCDALLDAPPGAGAAMLARLEAANLFLLPLDDERYWYRYHPLFADLLRLRLQQDRSAPPGAAPPELHIRASQWYEEQGHEIEAFQHAAAAGDLDRAERLIAGAGMPLYYRGALAPLQSWLESLPEGVLQARPSLQVTYAVVLTLLGRPVERIEARLQSAEAGLPDAEADAEADAATRDLIGQIAAVRAMLAIPQNQAAALAEHSRRALAYLHPDNLPMRTTAAWTLGYAHQMQGDRAAASQAYAEVLAASQDTGNTLLALGAATSLGQIQESENLLHAAAGSYRRALELAGDPPLPLACEAYVGLARVHYQWDDLPAAQEYGETGLRLARQVENVDTPAAALALLARVQLARGDRSAAETFLAQAESFLDQHPAVPRRPEVAAARVQALLQDGDAERAARLAQQRELPLWQARVRLAAGDAQAALALLEPLLGDAPDIRPDERLQARLLEALALHARGATGQALAALDEALAQAEPGGSVRLFLDEGASMAALLAARARQGYASTYLQGLLAAFGEPPAAPDGQPLVEPLTERELEVLPLLASYLTGPEIAAKLTVSVNTLRTHTKNIYSKLGVNNRQAAVRRAQELKLL